MPPRNLGTHNTVPTNAVPLTFPRSDGNPSRRPQQPPVPTDGTVNFYRPCTLDESISVMWRRTIAAALVKILNLDGAPPTYILSDFPDGYQLFDHNKGPKDNARHDAYLFGSTLVAKFRSPNEFAPHAAWLFGDASEKCICKYCSKSKYQSEISASLGLSTRPSDTVQRPTQIRRVTRPAPKTLVSPTQFTSIQRNADLRAASFGHRRFRREELVWVRVDPPITGPSEHLVIDFWPAVVIDMMLKCFTLPDPPEGEYKVAQVNVYKLKLLGVMHMHVVAEEYLLPYQGYILPDELMALLREHPPPGYISEDLRELSEYFPMPMTIPHVLERNTGHAQMLEELNRRRDVPFGQAASSFALALQIAAFVASYWSLTDDWTYKIAQSPASSPTKTDGPSSESHESSQTRFQGLFWGAERIWMDDLVRVKPARHRLQPPGDETSLLPCSPDAETRSYFMVISGIFIEDVMGKQMCMASGPIFELAPVDWNDPSQASQPAPVDAPPPLTPLSAPVRGNPAKNPPSDLNYPLPPPPPGYVFRRVLPEGKEMVVDVGTIAGRYYPDLLQDSPIEITLLRHGAIPSSGESAESSGWAIPDELPSILMRMSALWGLSPGYVHAMDCDIYKKSRRDMLKDADKEAREALYQFWKAKQAAQSQSGPGADVMEVDG